MVSADYHAFALANFSSGQILRYLHPTSGESITFQPQQLQWTNSANQIQAIADVASVVATIDDDVLRWTGAFGAGRDFVWQTSTDLLAKELILAGLPPAPPQFILDGGAPVLRLQFIIGLSAGATAWVDGVAWDRQTTVTTGSLVEFRDDGGSVLWRFNAATATDANGDNAPNVLTRFRRAGNSLFVEVRVPHSWLQSAAYPVSIDPTLSLQPDATAGVDCQIVGTVTTFNYGVYNELEIGRNSTVTIRALIRFDLSTLPAEAEISAATLSLYATQDFSSNASTLAVYRQKRAWTEGTGNGSATGDGATWNTYDGVNNWQTAGGFGADDCEQTDIGSRAFTATETLNEFKDIALTPTTKAGLDLGNGWLLKMTVENIDNRYDFASSDNATALNRPKLVIEYTEVAAGVPKHFMHYARLRQ